MGLATLWAKLGTNTLLCDRLTATDEGTSSLQLFSSSFLPDGEIPLRHARRGDNASIPLRWTHAPPETRSLVLAIEDPDAPRPRPFLHWLVYNIPPTVNALPAAMPPSSVVSRLTGLSQGQNSALAVGYTGPNPPAGDPPHRYHIQLFALDRILPLPPGAGRGDVEHFMRSHVIAKATLGGTYSRD